VELKKINSDRSTGMVISVDQCRWDQCGEEEAFGCIPKGLKEWIGFVLIAAN